MAEMDARLEEHEGAMEALKEKIRAKEAALEQLREVKAWQSHRDALEKCLAWSPVEETEKSVARLREALQESFPARAAAHAAQADSASRQLAALESRLDEQQRALQQANAALESHNHETGELKEAAKGAKREVRRCQAQLQAAQKELEELQAEHKELEEANREVAEDFLRSTQDALAAHRARVQQCRDAMERAQVAASAARQYRLEREVALEQAQRAVKDGEKEVAAQRGRVEQLQRELRRLQDSQASPLARFGGEPTVALHSAVQQAVQAGRFRHPPLLVGAQLALVDERWGAAVEAAIWRQLNNWVVDNHSDAKLLRSLAAQLPQKPQNLSVVVMRYDLPPHAIPPDRLPPADVHTVLSGLRFQEGPHAHVVRNVLIDQGAIERTVLADTQAQAVAVMRDVGFWHRYNITNVYARDGFRAYRRGHSEATMREAPRAPRLVRDLAPQVAECRAQLDAAQAEVARLEQEVAGRREAVEEARRDLQRAADSYQQAMSEKQAADSQYPIVRSEQPLDVADAAHDSDTAQRLARLAAVIADAEERVDAGEDALAAAQREAARVAERQAEARAAPQQLAEQLGECQEAITRLAEEKEGVTAQLREAQSGAEHVAAQLAQLRDALANAEHEFEVALSLAERHCSREEAVRVRGQLVAQWQAEGKGEDEVAALLEQSHMQRRLAQLDQRIERQEAAASATFEDVQLEMEALQHKLQKQQIRHMDAVEIHSICKAGYLLRRRKFKELRNSVADNLSRAFGRYMAMRGNRGSIDVQFKEQRLVFKVGIKSDPVTRDLRSLSGGERSMANLAFILALGHVGINPPFHALDEFDVFLDAPSRRVALAFLLEFGYKNPERQLFLLTPQDTSVLDQARAMAERALEQQFPPDFIKLLRMPPPRGRAQQQAV